MNKVLKYVVFALISMGLVFVVACNSGTSNQASDTKGEFVKASFDRGQVAATKADFTLANSKLSEKKGQTDKAKCFECHTTVSELHTRGVHKDVDCSFCHDIKPEHMDNPLPENRPVVHLEWEACGQCHDTQMHSFLEVGKHRPARFEKSNLNGRSPNPTWEKLLWFYKRTCCNSFSLSYAY